MLCVGSNKSKNELSLIARLICVGVWKASRFCLTQDCRTEKDQTEGRPSHFYFFPLLLRDPGMGIDAAGKETECQEKQNVEPSERAGKYVQQF